MRSFLDVEKRTPKLNSLIVLQAPAGSTLGLTPSLPHPGKPLRRSRPSTRLLSVQRHRAPSYSVACAAAALWKACGGGRGTAASLCHRASAPQGDARARALVPRLTRAPGPSLLLLLSVRFAPPPACMPPAGGQ